jgi:hypothetical protein
MLDELEKKLTAVVADALASRANVSVAESAGALPVPTAAGRGAVAVALGALEPQRVFSDDSVQIGDGPTSRRVLPLGFTATVSFARRSVDQTAPALATARTALLRDASLVAHALGALDVATGHGFETAGPDPGFEVRAFGLTTAELDTPRNQAMLRGSLGYAGSALIWPPAVTQPEGTIEAVAPLLEALPLTIAPDDPIVPVGSSTTVRIRPVSGRRLPSNGGGPTPPQLALLVVSDLPPAQRGAIASGTAATEAGVRLVPAGDAEVSVAYQAPTGDIGATRSEQVSVHLARPDGTRGVFLGSAAIVLAPGGP